MSRKKAVFQETPPETKPYEPQVVVLTPKEIAKLQQAITTTQQALESRSPSENVVIIPLTALDAIVKVLKKPEEVYQKRQAGAERRRATIASKNNQE